MISDLRTLTAIGLRPIRGESHAERLESFYASQAKDYDRFRRRLLPGRIELFEHLAGRQEFWVDMGCGTGESLDFMRACGAKFNRIALIDLCPSLLNVARTRAVGSLTPAIEILNADVTSITFSGKQPTLITFVYSLSMIPDWIQALERAYELLAPGGTIAVLDFYVSRKFPAAGRKRHGWFTRNLFPLWFSCDNVFLNSDHLPWLDSHFRRVMCSERRYRMPYLCGLKVPYYLYIGKKSSSQETAQR